RTPHPRLSLPPAVVALACGEHLRLLRQRPDTVVDQTRQALRLLLRLTQIHAPAAALPPARSGSRADPAARRDAAGSAPSRPTLGAGSRSRAPSDAGSGRRAQPAPPRACRAPRSPPAPGHATAANEWGGAPPGARGSP